jgi:hypothetical protein
MMRSASLSAVRPIPRRGLTRSSADEQVGPSELSRSWSIATLGFVERSLIAAL